MVTNIQDDIVDIVNKIDTIAANNAPGNKSSNNPMYRNPTDVPDYDAIEILAEADVHAVPADASVVSVEEFVPDILMIDQENHRNLSLN